MKEVINRLKIPAFLKTQKIRKMIKEENKLNNKIQNQNNLENKIKN